MSFQPNIPQSQLPTPLEKYQDVRLRSLLLAQLKALGVSRVLASEAQSTQSPGRDIKEWSLCSKTMEGLTWLEVQSTNGPKALGTTSNELHN